MYPDKTVSACLESERTCLYLFQTIKFFTKKKMVTNSRGLNFFRNFFDSFRCLLVCDY